MNQHEDDIRSLVGKQIVYKPEPGLSTVTRVEMADGVMDDNGKDVSSENSCIYRLNCLVLT